jgi:CheY-like chemotaxis protein
LSIEKVDFSLDNILANISNLFAFQMEEKGLELLFDIDMDVPMALRGDELRLNQVLTNLVSNAIKFTSKGEIIISIKLISRDEQNVDLRFDVKDTGIGISKEQIEKLFTSFSQADSSTTRKYGGSGLGLAISKQIVELRGGSVGLESTPNVGSDFYFTIKFELQEKQKNFSQTTNIKNLKVLVVDDNASSREILENILKSLKFEVKAICCGKEAIIELKEANRENSSYNLVLMDWMMPEMDGIETIIKINEDKEIADIPIFVMVTAYNKDELIEKAKDAHVFGFLEKPISPSTLYDTILKAFGKQIVLIPDENIKNNNFNEIKKMLHGSKILLVEDNIQNQEIALEFLQKAKIEVTIANNGKEAIEILQSKEEFDAVLMDCQMPIIDGYEATKLIRKVEKFKDLPIIAMTANAMQGDREKCIDSGMNDYIPKPLDFICFYDILEKWIKPKDSKEYFEDELEDEKIETNIENIKIEGINISQALSRMAGNEKLLLNQLKRFVESQNLFERKIQEYIKNNDLESAIREVHTLKGLCGNIGANLLFEKVKSLEVYLKEKGFDDKYLDLLESIKLDLNILIKNIEKRVEIFLPNLKLDVENKNLDKEEINSLLNELQQLLDELDSNAITKASELEAYLGKYGYIEEVEILMNCINEFNFDKASEYLKILREKI